MTGSLNLAAHVAQMELLLHACSILILVRREAMEHNAERIASL